MQISEFDIIATYFQRQNLRKDVFQGIGDDCAVLSPPSGKTLLASTDTLNIDQHFFPDTPPFDIGYKSVAVSLSDIAAMGGEPAWLLLSLTLPHADPNWLELFSQGLFACLEAFNTSLVGGNISKGPLSITTQIMGFGEPSLLSRSKAQPGDLIYVTGTLGDGGLSLAFLKGELATEWFEFAEINWLKRRLFIPTPRIREAQMISKIAHAAADISDGLLADLQHILVASHVGAKLYLEAIPMSAALKKIPSDLRTKMALTSGDDYELCFTIPSHQSENLKRMQQEKTCQFTCIGYIEKELGLRVMHEQGNVISFTELGFTHF